MAGPFLRREHFCQIICLKERQTDGARMEGEGSPGGRRERPRREKGTKDQMRCSMGEGKNRAELCTKILRPPGAAEPPCLRRAAFLDKIHLST